MDYESGIVAGVKTSRGGASKAPLFTPTACAECGERIETGKEASRVLRIGYEPKQRKLEWLHKAHMK